MASQSLRWSRRQLSAFVGGQLGVAARSNRLGRGSRERLVRLAVSLTPSVADATIEALDSPARGQLPVGFLPPSSPLPLVAVVRGEIDGFLAERCFKWDHAPWILLVQEAGGRFTDPAGGGASDPGRPLLLERRAPRRTA